MLRPEDVNMVGGPKVMERKVPSLVDICVQLAIDNVSHLGDVGETDSHLLERILPHCSLEQLMHIEDSSKERDLSSVTDKLWKNFFERQFGSESTNAVIGRMKQKNVSFQWRNLYEAKTKSVEDAQQKSFERIRKLYMEEKAKKQGRSVQICTKLPPSRFKRNFYGGPAAAAIANTKSSIMKKAKIDFLKSSEVRNLTAVKNNTVQRTTSSISSKPAMRKPGVYSGTASSSAPKISKPGMR